MHRLLGSATGHERLESTDNAPYCCYNRGESEFEEPLLDQRTLLYTHPDCDYSDLLKNVKDAEGVEYEEIDLALRPEAWADLEKLTDGERITPVLVEAGVVTVGYNGIG